MDMLLSNSKINMKYLCLSLLLFLLLSCTQDKSEVTKKDIAPYTSSLSLDEERANYLAQLPMKCISNPYPYKAGHTTFDKNDQLDHTIAHPAFYGCFDWHSAVHGHWSLVYLLKTFPDLENKQNIIAALDNNLSKENIETEVAYFTRHDMTKNYERPYGWAWIMKLALELQTWDHPKGKEWATNLQPLTDLLAEKYITYLPNLLYPIRVGEHSNTGFGLSFAYDYASQNNLTELKSVIVNRCKKYYIGDEACPIHYEPSGYDFLSPCLEEADIMRRVLSKQEFKSWFEKFLPGLADGSSTLTPADVKDRSDGKLVHLDGLNFSRAWCLYSIAADHPEFNHLIKIADNHMNYSYDKIVDGDYAGEHWLASFALYALQCNASI